MSEGNNGLAGDGPIAEPDFDALVKQMMGGDFMSEGWAGVENAGQAAQKMRDQMRESFQAENAAVYRCFRTEDGRKVMEILLAQTLRRSAWPAQMNFGMDVLTATGIFREGQNSIVAALIEAYAAAIDEEAEPRSET